MQYAWAIRPLALTDDSLEIYNENNISLDNVFVKVSLCGYFALRVQ